MAYKVQRRIPLRRRLHILRVLTNSNHANRNSITESTFQHIHKLKLALETIKTEYEKLIATRREYISQLNRVKENKEVKVEKITERIFMVKVICEKGGDKLVAILEAFEDMCLNVQQAKVSCESEFSLEAIVVAEDQTHLDVKDVTDAVLKAIEQKQSDEKNLQELEKCSNL